MPFRFKLKENLSQFHDQARAKASLLKRRTPQEPITQTSPLLRLPLEVRSMIYTALGLSGNTFHLLFKNASKDQVRHLRCLHPLSSSASGHQCPCLQARKLGPHYDSSAPLLRTCRLLHTETASVLYKENTFDFSQGTRIFYVAARTIGATNRQAIRDMRLLWPMKRIAYERPYFLGKEAVVLESLRMLREDMGPRLRVKAFVLLAQQSWHFDVRGLWAGEWWLEPLVEIGQGEGRRVDVVVWQPGKVFREGDWRAFGEEVGVLVNKGKGMVGSPWVREEGKFDGRIQGFYSVPGRFGFESGSDRLYLSV